MPLSLVLWTLLLWATPSKAAPPAAQYDQKQTGDYNIHLHLQDFQIIALLGGDPFAEEEFEYDYADFTVKPSTPAVGVLPPSTTTKPPLLEPGNGTAPAGQIAVQILDPLSIVPGEDVHGPPKGGLTGELSRCGAGFARDQSGRCRRLRKPPALQPLARLAAQLRLPLPPGQ